MPSAPLIEQRIEVGGFQAVLSMAGHGRVVVFLPSMLVSTRSYRRTINALVKSGMRVISVEMPGSGRGSRVMRPWGFEQYGNWIGALLQKLNSHESVDFKEPPILIGHSDSAGAALVAASKYSSSISRLVLCAGVGFDLKFSFWRTAIGRLIDVPLEPDFSVVAAVDAAYNMCRHFRNYFHHVWICTKTDLRPYAKMVRVPTLLAWGGRDHAISLRCARLALENIPQSQLYISRHGCHDWLDDHAEEFAEMVRDFI